MTKRLFLSLIAATFVLTSFVLTDNDYDLNKKYSAEQLKTDLKFMYDTLIRYHPRLYEFTPKKQMDKLFDSLTSNMTPMTEVEFRWYVTPLIASIHCSHTGIGSSAPFRQNFRRFYKAPPFKLYFDEKKAFIRLNFSDNNELSPGTEVLSINGTSSVEIINNFLARTTQEGIHKSAQYWKMNDINTTIFNGLRDYYKTEIFKVTIVDKNKSQKTVEVNAILFPDYLNLISSNTVPRNHKLSLLADGKVGLIDFPMFQFPNDSIRDAFFPSVFKELKIKKVSNLIIDLRGNGGGPGPIAGKFLQYLMPETFTYYNPKSVGQDFAKFKKPIAVEPDRYKGNIYFLIDGGCLSSCGHFLSMVKYHKLGKLIGEESTAGFSCNSIGVPVQMPNTQIDFLVPVTTYETNVKGLKRADGIPPDYEVKTKLADIIAKKEPVLDYALNLIKTNKK